MSYITLNRTYDYGILPICINIKNITSIRAIKDYDQLTRIDLVDEYDYRIVGSFEEVVKAVNDAKVKDELKSLMKTTLMMVSEDCEIVDTIDMAYDIAKQVLNKVNEG